MKIVISPRAEKQLKKASKVNQIAIANKIRKLAKPQRTAEKLQGYSDIERVRVGDYRIVYKLKKKQIFIVLIGHRREIYKQLRRLLR